MQMAYTQNLHRAILDFFGYLVHLGEKTMFIVLVCRPGRKIRLTFDSKIEQQAAAAMLKRYTLVVN